MQSQLLVTSAMARRHSPYVVRHHRNFPRGRSIILPRQTSAVPIRSTKPRQSLDHQPESPAQITSPKLGPGIGIEHQNHGSKSAHQTGFQSSRHQAICNLTANHP